MYKSIFQLDFFRYFIKKFNDNKLMVSAGYLTYSTMLAIVPLFMVSFAIFAAFPAFAGLTDKVKGFIFSNLTPQVGNIAYKYLDGFIANANKMSTFGIIGLIIVALILISAVDRTLNEIWAKTTKRTLFFSFAIYWMILTLGPLFLALSIGISSYIFSLRYFAPDGVLSFSANLLGLAPFFITWFAFSLIYSIVPNTDVNYKHALIGALLAAIFFTLGKAAFSWYIVNFPSYQIIYGALATLPILILWIQLSWIFILLGAQITAALGEYYSVKEKDKNMAQNIENKTATNEV